MISPALVPMQVRERGLARSLSSAFVATALAAWAANALAATSLDFDKTFTDRNEPGRIHYGATYDLGASAHRVEVWREGKANLRRRTDDALETHVFKPPGEVEWQMVVLDLKRRIRTDIDRTNLLRIGHFTDWFSLAHALARPIGPYELVALRGPAPRVAPIATCRWYLLTQGERASKVCWSVAWRVPLLITDRNDKVQWKVTDIATGRMPAGVFEVNDRGFVRNNANADIEAD